ncbi:hypothetical protein KVR01_005330 [Diaporthe batatas]|uniref:uncharacterized protein n=1 Tax=Diaporthe batatas TaxID=748121 RepID=UPI001D0410FD|nr:uncharacterized protein KVR01_005330 [Diaporthe batatas]KAG8165055.1 hypothetical protein KVR01_005330 [Diaporthe batatas]
MSTSIFKNVLIFGATGEVGSAVARCASSSGAKVWLGMRDINKQNTWLGKEEETESDMKRLHADLTDPVSLAAAVKESAATAAYIYATHSRDGMRSALQAMRDAGIQHTVFLSTSAVRGDIRAIPRSTFIPWHHAQVEISLEDLGMQHTAVRPGFFASNPFRLYLEPSKTTAKIFAPEQLHDPIDPQDIGRVCATVLTRPAHRSSGELKDVQFISGPRRLSQTSMWEIINTCLGRKGKPVVETVELTEEEYTGTLEAKGVPDFIAQSLVKSMGDTSLLYADEDFLPASKNVENLTANKPTSFEDFVEREIEKYFP